MKKGTKKLIIINLILAIILVFLFFSYKNQEATLHNIVVEKNNSQKSQNNVIDKKPGDENQEDKANEEFSKKFINIDKVKNNRINIERKIVEDFNRSKIKIDHIESLAYRDKKQTFINVLVFVEGYQKTIYSFTFLLNNDSFTLVKKEVVENASPIYK